VEFARPVPGVGVPLATGMDEAGAAVVGALGAVFDVFGTVNDEPGPGLAERSFSLPEKPRMRAPKPVPNVPSPHGRRPG